MFVRLLFTLNRLLSFQSQRHRPNVYVDALCTYQINSTFKLDINNVGSMSQVLYAHEAQQYDDAKAAGWQAAQVSTISLTNFLGRIFIGT